MTNLKLFKWPPMYEFKKYRIGPVNKETAIFIMEKLKIEGNLEDYRVIIKRRVCGKTWKEIL
jgi:hypothetical protein